MRALNMKNDGTAGKRILDISRYGACLAGVGVFTGAQAAVLDFSFTPSYVSFSSFAQILSSGGFSAVVSATTTVSSSIKSYSATVYGLGNTKIKRFNAGDYVSGGNIATNNTKTYVSTASGLDHFFGLYNPVSLLSGWFKISFDIHNDQVNGFVGQYETIQGKGIQIPSVPEPSLLGLFALSGLAAGASGVRRLRSESVQRDRKAG